MNIQESRPRENMRITERVLSVSLQTTYLLFLLNDYSYHQVTKDLHTNDLISLTYELLKYV